MKDKNIRQHEVNETRINKELEELREHLDIIRKEMEGNFNQFQLKADNGGQITQEYINGILEHVLKMNSINKEIADKLKQENVNIKNRGFDELIQDIINEMYDKENTDE